MTQATMLWSDQSAGCPPPPLVPSPPLIGNAPQILGDPLPFLVAMYERLGPIFRLRVAGRRFTVLAGPEANIFMAQADGDLLRSREFWGDFAAEWGAPNMLTSLNGEAHAFQRRMMKPGFARGAILERLPLMAEIVREHVRDLRPGQRVAVLPLVQAIVSDQLGELLIGRRAGADAAAVRLAIRYSLNALLLRQWPRLILAVPAYRRAYTRVGELAREIIAARRADPAEPRGDLADALIAASEAGSPHFTEADLLVAVLSPYIAGLDTVANTITFMIYELLTHPELLEQAIAEADTVLGRGELTPDALRELHTLHGAAMETLRMYPVAGVNQRTATRAFSFAGHAVDADETVLIAGGVAHYLPQIYPDPQRFDIGRYEPPRNEHRRRGAFAPFGVGPHTCLGAGLAEVQIAVTVATLLRELRVAPEPAYRRRVRLDPTITLGRGFRVEVVGRRLCD